MIPLSRIADFPHLDAPISADSRATQAATSLCVTAARASDVDGVSGDPSDGSQGEHGVHHKPQAHPGEVMNRALTIG